MISTDLAYCEATLNYSRGDGDHEPVNITVHDGRAALDHLNFESCGFTLLEHHSNVKDWRDQAHLEKIHGPEIEELARRLTGCDRTLVFFDPLLEQNGLTRDDVARATKGKPGDARALPVPRMTF